MNQFPFALQIAPNLSGKLQKKAILYALRIHKKRRPSTADRPAFLKDNIKIWAAGHGAISKQLQAFFHVAAASCWGVQLCAAAMAATVPGSMVESHRLPR